MPTSHRRTACALAVSIAAAIATVVASSCTRPPPVADTRLTPAAETPQTPAGVQVGGTTDLAQALARARDGDTIVLSAGVIRVDAELPALEKRVTVRGAGRRRTRIELVDPPGGEREKGARRLFVVGAGGALGLEALTLAYTGGFVEARGAAGRYAPRVLVHVEGGSAWLREVHLLGATHGLALGDPVEQLAGAAGPIWSGATSGAGAGIPAARLQDSVVSECLVGISSPAGAGPAGVGAGPPVVPGVPRPPPAPLVLERVAIAGCERGLVAGTAVVRKCAFAENRDALDLGEARPEQMDESILVLGPLEGTTARSRPPNIPDPVESGSLVIPRGKDEPLTLPELGVGDVRRITRQPGPLLLVVERLRVRGDPEAEALEESIRTRFRGEAEADIERYLRGGDPEAALGSLLALEELIGARQTALRGRLAELFASRAGRREKAGHVAAALADAHRSRRLGSGTAAEAERRLRARLVAAMALPAFEVKGLRRDEHDRLRERALGLAAEAAPAVASHPDEGRGGLRVEGEVRLGATDATATLRGAFAGREIFRFDARRFDVPAAEPAPRDALVKRVADAVGVELTRFYRDHAAALLGEEEAATQRLADSELAEDAAARRTALVGPDSTTRPTPRALHEALFDPPPPARPGGAGVEPVGRAPGARRVAPLAGDLIVAAGPGIARVFDRGTRAGVPLSVLDGRRPLAGVVPAGPRRVALAGPLGAVLHDLDLEQAIATTAVPWRQDPPATALVHAAEPVPGSLLVALAETRTRTHEAAILRDIAGRMADRLVVVAGGRGLISRADGATPPVLPEAAAHPGTLLGADRVAFLTAGGRLSVEPLDGGMPLLQAEGFVAVAGSPDLSEVVAARPARDGGRLSAFQADPRGYGAGPPPPALPSDGGAPRHLLWLAGGLLVLADDGSIWLVAR